MKIADLGAGTGIFSEELLKQGSQVILVEPNVGMLEKLEKNCVIIKIHIFYHLVQRRFNYYHIH